MIKCILIIGLLLGQLTYGFAQASLLPAIRGGEILLIEIAEWVGFARAGYEGGAGAKAGYDAYGSYQGKQNSYKEHSQGSYWYQGRQGSHNGKAKIPKTEQEIMLETIKTGFDIALLPSDIGEVCDTLSSTASSLEDYILAEDPQKRIKQIQAAYIAKPCKYNNTPHMHLPRNKYKKIRKGEERDK